MKNHNVVAFAIKENNQINVRLMPHRFLFDLKPINIFKHQKSFWKQWEQEKNINFAPFEKGLAVIDFDEKCVFLSGLLGNLDVFYSTYHSDTGSVKEAQKEKLQSLWDNDCLADITGTDEEKQQMQQLLLLSFEEALPEFEKLLEKRDSAYALNMRLKSPSGWNFEWFKPEKLNALWSRLEQHGFSFTDDDVVAWENYLIEKKEHNFMQVERERRELQSLTPSLSSPKMKHSRL
jgi:hypothetical protein